MKKMTALIVALIVLAAVIRGFAQSPSTLELRVLLTEGAPILTPTPRTYVGFVADGGSEKPTLGNIRRIQPNEGTENIYEVPPNRRIGIFVLSRGVPHFQSTISVKPRQYLMHDVILDAGIVQVTTEQIPPASNSNIWYLDPNGEFDSNHSFVNGVEFLVPAGEQIFQVDRYLEAKRERINVVAGQTHHINIISQTGSLSVDIETTIPFEELSPTPILTTATGSKLLHLRNGKFDAGRWQFGSYDASLELSERFRHPIRPASIGPIRVTIDQLDNSMTIPLSLIGVTAQFYGWDEKIPGYATAMVISLDDPGLPFATSRVANRQAPLIFIPPRNTHGYAIALVANNAVLALRVVESLTANDPQDVTVFPGGDFSLCEKVILEFDCSSLSQ